MVLYALSVLATALALLLVDFLIPGVVVANFPAAILAGILIGIVNAVIKPILFILSLPITILTLGLFALVVNGICFWLASLVTPGFSVHGFWAFILGPIVLSMVSTLLNNFFVGQISPGSVEDQPGS
ncbi:MAG TPA: phage holin family protein [Leptolyngbyaceae cyanobacterium M65_K2018_010]|nr:phage holin family protein [Leptolyngbyaceae cyanobacterium M65_K2018_010]